MESKKRQLKSIL